MRSGARAAVVDNATDAHVADDAADVDNPTLVVVGEPGACCWRKQTQFFLSILNSEIQQTIFAWFLFISITLTGIGRSALLANWAEQHRLDHPEHAIVTHFVGCTSASTGVASMLKRLLFEVEQQVCRAAAAAAAAVKHFIVTVSTHSVVGLRKQLACFVDVARGARR